MSNAMICSYPFSMVEVHSDLSVYPCCPLWSRYYCLGNLSESSFSEIWHGDRARIFRRNLLRGNDSLCDRDVCMPSLVARDDPVRYAESPPPPLHVKFGQDNECNYGCNMCIGHPVKTSEEHLSFLNGMIESTFVPMMNGVHSAGFSCNGDGLANRHYQALIGALSATYPLLRFSFHTNGSLCNRDTFRKLGIEKRIDSIIVSFHAATPRTYRQLTGTGSFERVIGNLAQLSEMTKDGDIPHGVTLVFAVQSLNFYEMPLVIKIADLFGFDVKFWELHIFKRGDEALDVCSKSHPEHEALRVVLKSICQQPFCEFSPILQKIASE